MEKDQDAERPTPEEFEEFVAAALKVDPKGLSGKHRREGDDKDAEDGSDDH